MRDPWAMEHRGSEKGAALPTHDIFVVLTPYAESLREDATPVAPLELMNDSRLSPAAFGLAVLLYSFPRESPPRLAQLNALRRTDDQSALHELIEFGWAHLEHRPETASN